MHLNSWAIPALLVTLALAPTARADEEPRDHTYSIGVGLQGNRFALDDGTRMGAAGPALTVNYTVGKKFGFALRGTIFFPLHGRESVDQSAGGSGVNLRSMYDVQRLAFDGTFMFYRRLRPTPSLDVVFGVGLHFQTFRLISSQMLPIELISGGLGGMARVERRFGRRFFFGGELAASFDPIDFIHHKNPTVFVAPVALSAVVGVRR